MTLSLARWTAHHLDSLMATIDTAKIGAGRDLALPRVEQARSSTVVVQRCGTRAIWKCLGKR